MSKRAKRREQTKRIKERAKKIIKGWGGTDLSDRNVGRVASVHGAGCSCMKCGNPRHKWNSITRQEELAKIEEKDQKKDLQDDE